MNDDMLEAFDRADVLSVEVNLLDMAEGQNYMQQKKCSIKMAQLLIKSFQKNYIHYMLKKNGKLWRTKKRNV